MLPLLRFIVKGRSLDEIDDVFADGISGFYKNAEAAGIKIDKKERYFIEMMIYAWLLAAWKRHVDGVGAPTEEWEECYASFKQGGIKVKAMVVFFT